MRSSCLTSARRGTFCSTSGSSVSRAAIISGRAAFLAPEIGISPFSSLPPIKRIRSIVMSYMAGIDAHLPGNGGRPSPSCHVSQTRRTQRRYGHIHVRTACKSLLSALPALTYCCTLRSGSRKPRLSSRPDVNLLHIAVHYHHSRPKLVYGLLTVSVPGDDWGSGACCSDCSRALLCPFRRLRFSRSFAANLCSRWAACWVLDIAVGNRVGR